MNKMVSTILPYYFFIVVGMLSCDLMVNPCMHILKLNLGQVPLKKSNVILIFLSYQGFNQITLIFHKLRKGQLQILTFFTFV